jgi:CheY-like chemotaxis protein
MKKILVIEDTLSFLNLYKEKLQLEGFEVYTATDGEEGLSLALEVRPELILLDVMMPKMDGITLMKKLRQSAWGKTVPIIILTNMPPDADSTLETIIEDQPVYYLLKQNALPEDVVEKVKEVLTKSQ